jgi:hypothetical protein
MAESPPSNQAHPLASSVAIAKDAFALLRDFALFAVAILLVVFPSTFNSILTNAGFEEGSFAGIKWKRQFYDTDTALRTAQDTITSLQTQNSDLLKALAESKSHAPDLKQREELAKLESASRATTEAASQVQASVGATLANNDPLVEKARAAISLDAPPSTAFCYQEDKLQPGAQRYSVHCHATLAKCESARGPNPRTKQSVCEEVKLSGVQWKPRHPGWMGSWFEFRSEPFERPFPPLRS